MARRGQTPTRIVAPDPVFNNVLLTKFINGVMLDGKKSVAQAEVYEALEKIGQDSGEEALPIFLSAIDQVKPLMEVRPRRVGGAAYQVPMQVRGPRRESLAIRWLIMAARARSNKDYHTFAEKLAAEIIDASRGLGGAIGKKKDMERVAEANRAFAHFKW
ncbi:30S ribosomal protein S7 [Candidatus Microgenomates bacterium]|nr:30S ribosomal protein S7 [Candidatus Microgenomates bacterium]